MFSYSFHSAYKHCATLKGITLLISTLTKERRDHDLVLVKSENSYGRRRDDLGWLLQRRKAG
jgi:hypothetical protein